MTDLQTLQAQVNYLASRVGGLAGRAAAVVGTDVPATAMSATTTSFANLTRAYTIPGGDPAANSVYRLSAWGDLLVGTSTSAVYTWSVAAYGMNAASGTPLAACSIGASYLANALALSFEWKLEAALLVKTAGSGGVIDTFLAGDIALYHGTMAAATNLGNLLTGGQPNSLALAGGQGDTAVDTTAATTIALQGQWGGATPGANCRGFGSTLERIGP
jgi:hypothetical protein